MITYDVRTKLLFFSTIVDLRIGGRNSRIQLESLILAQNERWRQA